MNFADHDHQRHVQQQSQLYSIRDLLTNPPPPADHLRGSHTPPDSPQLQNLPGVESSVHDLQPGDTLVHSHDCHSVSVHYHGHPKDGFEFV